MVKLIKYIIIFALVILFSSFNPCNDAREFHVEIVGEERVELFEEKFPQIVCNREVYIAYLQKYYRGNEDAFMNLLRRKR